MQIITNPTKKMLDDIQSLLNKEKYLGIMDIYTNYHPRYFVVLDHEVPAAIATVHGSNECPELYKLYVVPNYRNKGVAMDLVTHVMRQLASEGAEEVFVEMTEQSVNFWDKVSDKFSYELIEGSLKVFFKPNG